MGTTALDMTPDISTHDTAATTAPESGGGSEPRVPATEDRRGRLAWIIGGLVVIAVLAVVGFFFFQARDAGGALPESFPAHAELPLVDGEIAGSAELPGAQTEVTVRVADPAQQAAALTALTDAGYRVIGSEGSGPIGTVTSLSSETHSVRVSFDQDSDGAFTVTYLTSPRAGADTEQ
ncbi:hypothetical protein [Leucobacter luti]|uniref:Uncharacterized protein n=1 Tax=Leucobacter luti TaxID=340320 RepID=A0A4Q7U2I2_9MICO|nr:hypothetical protein [Leucobacter luti]MBL3699149.1 hypothetical protein [Leucobacter luti]RZT66648.1 hypothetical protein EV139_0771 [Leucobacter luti]